MASKVNISEEFTGLLEDVRQHAQLMSEALAASGSSPFFLPRPDNWIGDTAQPGLAAQAFNHQSLEREFQEALSTAAGGVVGDLTLAQVQGDFMSMVERAYHSRHASAVRCRAHAAARAAGHAHTGGVLAVGIGGYVKHLAKRAKS